MGRLEIVTCDGCEKDITYRTNIVDYRIALMNDPKPLKPGLGMVTDMNLPRELDRPYYFCGLNCLDEWRVKDRAR